MAGASFCVPIIRQAPSPGRIQALRIGKMPGLTARPSGQAVFAFLLNS
jgi:hypothetical protein